MATPTTDSTGTCTMLPVNTDALISMRHIKKVFATDGEYHLAGSAVAGLSVPERARVRNRLSALHHRGATICMVTHDPRYAEQADRSVHLFDGRIVEDAARVVS